MATAAASQTAGGAAGPLPKIEIYSTLTKKKAALVTVQPGRVGMYLCGPTVYKPSHIGHMVGPVIFDTVKRYLEYSGWQVTWVVNITDVDDKIIAESTARGTTMAKLAAEMTTDYLENLACLGVTGIDVMPKATEHIGTIITFIEGLIAKGCAYASDGDVYFDVTRDPDYGKLTNRSIDSTQGEGGSTAERKRSAADFALWKNSLLCVCGRTASAVKTSTKSCRRPAPPARWAGGRAVPVKPSRPRTTRPRRPPRRSRSRPARSRSRTSSPGTGPR